MSSSAVPHWGKNHQTVKNLSDSLQMRAITAAADKCHADHVYQGTNMAYFKYERI